MMEDRLDKDIAASLKKKLAEASVPYELGAWEGFQKKRALRKRREIASWVSGIAASLILLAVGLNAIDVSEKDNTSATEIQLVENSGKSTSNTEEKILIQDPSVADVSQAKVENTTGDDTLVQELKSTIPNAEKLAKAPEVSKQQLEPSSTEALAVLPEPVEKTAELGKALVATKDPITPLVKQFEEKIIIQEPPLIAATEEAEKAEKQLLEKSNKETLALEAAEKTETKVADLNTQVPTSEKEKFIAERDFPEMEKEKASVGLGVGVSPGFGGSQTGNQVATAQTIGVGMLLDIKLPGKLTLGSGLGLNYLSQNTEQQSTVMAFGNTYPQTEKLEVRQVQVEVPVFVKYPLTKNNAISLQAGFSNFYALNQSGSQENSFNRQVANYSMNSAGFSSVTLTNQTVNSTSALQQAESKFYPFATLNFGLNLRLLESKSANYVIMPFYNYQLKQVSGYGDTFGLFGATLKMNFGGSR